ncbi:kinase-like domain-containing protein [Lanmaoa asiatica]|nr:kinase-like domain-containing protein [Lanmaoa asiatica]
MYPFYDNVPPPVHPSYHQSQFVNAIQDPPAAPYALAIPHNHSSPAFYEMVKQRYTDSDSRLRGAISRSWFPNSETRRQCLDFVDHLRIHRNLFMHTYVHLMSCCNSGHLRRLAENAHLWKRWGSIQQLTHHSLIKDELLSFWTGHSCHQHEFLFAQRFVISDDDNDFLCHLLYCGTKPELYKLPDKPAIHGHGYYLKESEQVIELLWQFLMKPQESDVARRLRAHIYRMARKSAYLPRALQIAHPSISNKRNLGPGGNGMVMKATMNGRDVVIKEILCGDHTRVKKCLEMFASEAILWTTLRHKNIVQFLGVVADGTLNMGLVSPFFRNGNIRNHLKKYDSKDWPALARRWGKDLAEGLEYIHCHEPPIVHGDIKGDNVLVDDDDHALLGDFGQSYASDSGKYLDSTRVGLTADSPVHWMAPELMYGGDRVKASEWSDIYSFGCVLYEMTSGKIPFEGRSPGYVMKYVQNGQRPSKPESINSNDPLWKMTKSCWKDHPEDRPSAEDLVSLLHKCSFL